MGAALLYPRSRPAAIFSPTAAARSDPGLQRCLAIRDRGLTLHRLGRNRHAQRLLLRPDARRCQVNQQRQRSETAEEGVRAFLLQSLDLKTSPPTWRLNLDALEAEMAKIIGWEAVAGSFEGPALFLSGAHSDYVRPEHRETIRALFPAARFAKIPGAGHWLHAEKPREFEAALAAFLG